MSKIVLGIQPGIHTEFYSNCIRSPMLSCHHKNNGIFLGLLRMWLAFEYRCWEITPLCLEMCFHHNIVQDSPVVHLSVITISHVVKREKQHNIHIFTTPSLLLFHIFTLLAWYYLDQENWTSIMLDQIFFTPFWVTFISYKRNE